MKLIPNYYQNRVCLNVLANSIENAKAIYEAAESHVVIGVLSKNYSNIQSAIDDMKKYSLAVNNALSIGLGAGDPNQSTMVSKLAQVIQPQHVNQVFTGTAISRTLLGQNQTIVNALVSPTGKVGYVKISTGPLSSKAPDAIVPVEAAIAMLQDMGASALKFFPMAGLKHKDEFIYVANACAKYHFYLEPTGGIDLDNFETIMRIALDAGVSKIIPHIYSSIIDPISGATKPDDVRVLLEIIKNLLG